MSLKINEYQPGISYQPRNALKDEKLTVAQNTEISAADSKRGEVNLFAALRKNSLINIPAINALDNPKQNSLNSQAETFATVPNAVFPFAGSKIGMFPPLIPILPENDNLTMGNPTDAMTNVDTPNNYLLVKDQYTSSYDRDRGIPNWTSWHLGEDSLGSTRRQNDFRPDSSLPDGWYQVTPQDYSGSGYDRGHMTPSGDRTSSPADNSATFLMTNMIPQASKNNQQTWANLENYCRELVEQGNELYVIAGGEGTKGYIADGRVAVPEYTWKVVLVQPEGTNDLSRVTEQTRIISVYIPNDDSVVSDWRQYSVSADYVEAQTGYDFFSNLPDNVENAIEAKVDR